MSQKINSFFSRSARVNDETILASVQEINNHVVNVRQAVTTLQTKVTSPMPRNFLDPTKDMPLFVDDALGNTIEIPLRLVHSWEVCDSHPLPPRNDSLPSVLM